MSRAAPTALNVRWHDGRLVGRVIINGPTYFAFDEEWFARGRSGAISTDEAGRKLPIVSTIPGTDGHGSCQFQWNFPLGNAY